MKGMVFSLVVGVGLMAVNCAGTPEPAPMRAPALQGSVFSQEMKRGPWDPETLKAAEELQKTAPPTELEKKRQALAAAYVYWGEALFDGFRLQPKAPAVDVPFSPDASQGATGPGSQTPPAWYWAEQQQHRFDHLLQQQWQQYYQNRTPPPQFKRAPNCQSIMSGGQVITSCY